MLYRSNLEYPWEADSLRSMSYASKSQGERWDRIKDFWIGRANLYDEIDNDTASLFTESLPLHRQAGTMLNQFMQCRLTTTPTKGNPSRNLSGNGTKYNEAEEYAKDYLKQHGMTEEEIAKIDLNLLSSLYATLHWSTKDLETIIKNILRKTYDDLFGYLMDQYGWSTEKTKLYLYKLFVNRKIEELNNLYQKGDYSGIDNIVKSEIGENVINDQDIGDNDEYKKSSATMQFPKPGEIIKVSYGTDKEEGYEEVESYNSWSIKYSIKGCNENYPQSLCTQRLNSAISKYPYNDGEEDLLKFDLPGYDQPVFAGAMVEGYADIGDIVLVKLDNGESFYFMILDTKSTQHTSKQLSLGQIQCEYGHGYVAGGKVQLCICEFIMSERRNQNSAISTESGRFLSGRYVTESIIIDHVDL